MNNAMWDRFLLLARRAGKFIELFTECAPYLEEFKTGVPMAPDMMEKLDYCLRGMEHFMPFLEKFKAFMVAIDETPMELVDPDILEFLDSI